MNAQSMRKNRRRAFCRRNKSMRGGGLGNSYSFGPAVGEVANYRASVVPMSSCGDASRPGFLSGITPKGLPGLSGGRRRNDVEYLTDTTAVDYPDAMTTNQMGGRYTTGFEVTGPGIPLATHTSIPCDVATQNPLNQGYDIKSLVTSTGAQSLSPAPLKGGKRKSRKTRKLRKSKKAMRKSRKGSRKSRKGSRKSRKGRKGSRKH